MSLSCKLLDFYILLMTEGKVVPSPQLPPPSSQLSPLKWNIDSPVSCLPSADGLANCHLQDKNLLLHRTFWLILPYSYSPWQRWPLVQQKTWCIKNSNEFQMCRGRPGDTVMWQEMISSGPDWDVIKLQMTRLRSVLLTVSLTSVGRLAWQSSTSVVVYESELERDHSE